MHNFTLHLPHARGTCNSKLFCSGTRFQSISHHHLLNTSQVLVLPWWNEKKVPELFWLTTLDFKNISKCFYTVITEKSSQSSNWLILDIHQESPRHFTMTSNVLLILTKRHLTLQVFYLPKPSATQRFALERKC